MITQNTFIENLYSEYQSNTQIRGLIELLSFTGIPANSLIETFVGTSVAKMRAARLKSFYDELNEGKIILTDEIISKDEFLHSYFSIVNYVIISKSDEKAKRFARIIRELYAGQIDIWQFEDFTSIFNELSEREFMLLCIKVKFEKENQLKSQVISNGKPEIIRYMKTMEHWEGFISQAKSILNVSQEELEAILLRLQRTGCYRLHNYEDKLNQNGAASGDTTIIFKKIYEIVENLDC